VNSPIFVNYKYTANCFWIYSCSWFFYF